MSTTPTPVTSTTPAVTLSSTGASLESAVKAAEAVPLTWLQKHERIIIVFLVLVAGCWLGNHWLNNRAVHDKQVSDVAAQQVTEQKAKDAQLASQAAELSVQYQAIVSQLSEQNARLSASMASRTVVLEHQQAADTTMPVSDLVKRWSTLTGILPTAIVALPSGVTVTNDGARQTVSQLEKVPVLTANLKDETTVADNRQQELDKANLLVGGLNQQVSGLNLAVTDGAKACKAETASLKADAAKSKRNWFVRGLVIGATVVATLALHF